MLSFLKTFIDSDVVHRDIKPENLGITDDGTIISIDNESIREASITDSFHGTLDYLSKQAHDWLKNHRPLTKEDQQSLDAFATAHTIYEIWTGQSFPCEANTDENLNRISEKINNMLLDKDSSLKQLLLDMTGTNSTGPYTGGKNLYGAELSKRIAQYLNRS